MDFAQIYIGKIINPLTPCHSETPHGRPLFSPSPQKKGSPVSFRPAYAVIPPDSCVARAEGEVPSGVYSLKNNKKENP